MCSRYQQCVQISQYHQSVVLIMVYQVYALMTLPVNTVILEWICSKMKLFCAAEGCNLYLLIRVKSYSSLHGCKMEHFITFPTSTKKKKMRKLWMDVGKNKYFDQLSRKVVGFFFHFIWLKGPIVTTPVPMLFKYNNFGGLLRVGKHRYRYL